MPHEIVPINRNIGLDAVLQAADAYFHRTGRQVTYEYVLLHQVNDRPSDAQALAARLRGKKSHVNLIPYNPVAGLPYHRPPDSAIERFVAILRAGAISVTVRHTKGRAIDAACGQLRRRAEQDAEPAGIPAPNHTQALEVPSASDQDDGPLLVISESDPLPCH